MVKYGVSHTDIFTSVWCVVEAINRVEEFFIVYPRDHDKQRQIAAGFRAVLQAGFDNCAGAIDGILIWIHKPSQKQSDKCIGDLENSTKFPEDNLRPRCAWF